MTWRDQYKVHPAADVFPMMSDEELDALAADIRVGGVRMPIALWGKYDGNGKFHGELIDGRNRLEAAERAGFEVSDIHLHHLTCGDPVNWVKALNLHRRHMLKSERADAIVALAKMEAENKPGQAGPVSEAKGGRGKKSPVKEKALAINADLPEEQQVSERTIKRSIAKAEGKKPKPSKPRPGVAQVIDHDDDEGEEADEGDESSMRLRGLTACCAQAKIAAEDAQHHLDWLHEHGTVDGDAALDVWQACYVWESVHRLLTEKRASTLPPEPRSEGDVGDPAPKKRGRPRK